MPTRSRSHRRALPLSAVAVLIVWLASSPRGAAQEPVPEEGLRETRPRVGLVLSGGGARGAAHAGVLDVLEELRVPVDYVVGTSMGAIVGGLYAAGYSPEEIARTFEEADWASILSDAPPRNELWFRRREDERRFQIDLVLGWDGGLVLPPGLLLGVNVEAFLGTLLDSVGTDADFDELRIPFRCVATDIADGSGVVLASGSLPRSIRASMSLPGIFAPVELGGRTLIDGGVVDNVPVNVARGLGADVVIVVDISSPLADESGLRSMLNVSNQVIGILMAENRRRSMDSLTEADVGIVPDLGDIGVMAFDRAPEAIRLGRASMESVRERLSRFSVDEPTWAAWRTSHRRRPRVPYTLREVRVDGRTTLSDNVIRALSELRGGDALDEAAITRARARIAGLGVYERVEVDVVPVPGSPGVADVVLRPIEKSWGPNYLRFRFGASSDLRGSGEFDVGVQHTSTPLNGLGGELRNEVQVGTRTRLFSEFYQPFDANLRWFVAPSIEYEQDNVPLIVNGEKVAEFGIDALEAGVAVGRNLGSWGEARVRYGWVSGTARPTIALPGSVPGRVDVGRRQITATLTADTLDRIRFPRAGLFASAAWESSNEALGGDSDRSVREARAGGPLTFGDLTVYPSVEVGTTLEGQGQLASEFFLGGFQRLSGFGQRSLSGNHYALGVVQSYYRLSGRTTAVGLDAYVGGSLELGGIWQTRDQIESDELVLAGSLFVAVDTFLGPVYVGYGLAEGGEDAAYVFIEPIF